MVAIAVRLQRGHTPVRGKSAREQSGRVFTAQAIRTPRTPLQLCLSLAGTRGERRGLHVDRPSKGRGAVAARPDAALDLDAVEAVGEIGEVREVQDLVFGIVQRDAVDREVDP